MRYNWNAAWLPNRSVRRVALHGSLHLLPALVLLLMMATAVPGQSLADVPGVPIDYHMNASRYYFMSDNEILVLSNGDYLASHAWAGSASTQSTSGKTAVFRSTDQGATWAQTSLLDDIWRASLFEYQGDTYLYGQKYNGGPSVVRKSSDGGDTWTTATSSTTGLFSFGGPGTPNNPVVHDGRLWMAASTSIFSAPLGSNLLHQSSWTVGNSPPWNNYFDTTTTKWFEGQVVASSDTGVYVLPKIRALAYTALIEVTSPNTTSFTPDDFVQLPGGEKKFGATYDPVSEKFYVLSNPVLAAHADDPVWASTPEMIRNTAAVISSKDLYHWDVEGLFLYTPNLDYEGFQYLQFDFDGDDIVVAARTAFDIGGTMDRGHDSNMLTFHRIEDFRSLAPDHHLVADTANNQVLRFEATQHEDAPLGKFTLGTDFAGAALNRPTDLAQDTNGDVYIREEGGRILRFDALGNFIAEVASSPVPFQGTQLSIQQAAHGERAWMRAESSDWSELTNWYYWGRPDTSDEVAMFGSAIGYTSTVTVDDDYTIKGLRFNNDNRYILGGSGSLTLEAYSGNALVDVQKGTHWINVDVTLNDDVDLTMPDAGARLVFYESVDLNGNTLFKTGDGRLDFENAMVLNGGCLKTDGLAPIVFSSSSAGQLDLNGDFAFAPDAGLSLEFGETFDLLDGLAYFDGETFDHLILPGLDPFLLWDTDTFYSDGVVRVSAHFPGDADIDGDCDVGDLGLLAANYNQSGSWEQGDFDGDGDVNVNDLGILATAYGTDYLDTTAGASSTPEPATLSLMGLGALALLMRRRRK